MRLHYLRGNTLNCADVSWRTAAGYGIDILLIKDASFPHLLLSRLQFNRY